MKGGRWDLFNAPATASWVIKKLCKVKETLHHWMNTPNYSIAKVYNDLQGIQAKAVWANTAWNRATTPRSRFILWLAYQDRLKTKHKLMNMGVIDNDTCPICGSNAETTDHLFFKCEFSRQCVDMVRQWLKVPWNVWSLKDTHRKRHMPRRKVRIIEAILGNLVYAIWRTRNEAVWNQKVTSVRKVVDSIKQESKTRLTHLSWSTPIHNWMKELFQTPSL